MLWLLRLLITVPVHLSWRAHGVAGFSVVSNGGGLGERSQTVTGIGSRILCGPGKTVPLPRNECDTRDFVDCWSATTVSINPFKKPEIDLILQGLVSPAPQSYFVIQRALHRLQPNNSAQADDAASICHHLIKRGHRLLLRNCTSLEDNNLLLPGLDWTVRESTTEATPDGWWSSQPLPWHRRTHQIAQDILDYVVQASDLQLHVDVEYVETMVRKLSQRLELTLGTDLRGRTGVDTMFALALAGVSSQHVYHTLETVIWLEVDRVRHRSSLQQSHQLIHIVEKLAAAGGVPHEKSHVSLIHRNIGAALMNQSIYMDTTAALLAPSEAVSYDLYCLLHERPLLWIWRFASRLSKPVMPKAAQHEMDDDIDRSYSDVKRWTPTFGDVMKPLVIDLGCGFGVTALGLATQRCADPMTRNHVLPDNIRWGDCNFLGADVQQLGLRFASGVAHRWSNAAAAASHEPSLVLSSVAHLQYAWISTHDLLDQLVARSELDYPGRIPLFMLQFPTPYRLTYDVANTGTPSSPTAGNLQLPEQESLGFMGSSAVLEKIASILTKYGGGRLLVQSNCEDVAVQIRNTSIKCGFTVVHTAFPVEHARQDSTERTKRWIHHQRGMNESLQQRAVGPEWSAVPLLPLRCASETDIACQLQGSPVHRILLQI